MIILPDRNMPRAKFLMPVPDKEWKSPSSFVLKDQLGNDVVRTKFRIDAKSNDGVIIWSGLFDDRADFDAFLWAIASGALKQEKALWNLPTPNWQPYLDEIITYEFVTVTFLTSTGIVRTYTVPADWNSNNNTIVCIGGAGQGGGVTGSAGVTISGGGGGGGACALVTNITLTPSASVSYKIGEAGSIAFSGNSTFFGATTFASSTVGAQGGLNGQDASSGTPQGVGSSGGSGSTSIGTLKYSGGTGATATTSRGGGGGGAAGPGGAGGNGNGLIGGDANNGELSGPATARTNGFNGTTWDATHGSGTGGAGATNTSKGSGGDGGDYGGAGAGGLSTDATSYFRSSGSQGIITIIYGPSLPGGFNMPILGM